MAKPSAQRPTPNSRTICLPILEEHYRQIVDQPAEFRRWLEEAYRQTPELFPEGFEHGFEMKDRRDSKKQGLAIRRIALRDGTAWSIRPSFMMPFMTARTNDVSGPLFLRKFSVPFWALAYVFGRDAMFWYRQELALGRNSLVGTTIRRAELPEHLSADEHHQRLRAQKTYIATTVAAGCYLGAELSDTAGTEDLKAAYGVFRTEAQNVSPGYQPKTVNTDGWKSTQAAWTALFPLVTILQCFLHAWLKIRDRAKAQRDQFAELSRKVWEAYHAPNRQSFSQRIRRLRDWASAHLSGVVKEKTLDLCDKRDLWAVAYEHPEGHRTSNMLDRLMRGMNRYFVSGQRLHGHRPESRRHPRSLALLWNFAPWSPKATRANNGWQSPAERLNQHRYHNDWLQNLLISASCGGYRHPHKT